MTDWPQHAKALDMHLKGWSRKEIARALGVTRARVHQMLGIAARRLAYRVFLDVPKYRWKHNPASNRLEGRL
jgi:hypothetical protein